MVIDRVDPLDHVNEVMESLESGGVVGRAIIDVAGVG
jgi:hypothetical protein